MNWCRRVFLSFCFVFLGSTLTAQKSSVISDSFSATIGQLALTLLADDFIQFVSPTADNARILMSISDSLFSKTLVGFGYRSSERGIPMEYLISSSKKTSHFRMIKRAGKGLVMTFSPSYSWLEELVKKQSGMTYRIEEDTEEYVGRTWAIQMMVVRYGPN